MRSPVETVNYQGLELEYLSQKYVQIHGMCHLPPGEEYMLARLPTDYDVDWEEVKMKVEGMEVPELKDEDSSISSNYSLTRPMIALFQILSAVPVIYQAHSDESRQSHGYAGYQLTVIPFALMSIINTFQTMVTPSYGASYMVRSDVMDEAERRGGVFQGVVGRVFESTKKISLDSSVKDYGEIIGEIGAFVPAEQSQDPEGETSSGRATGNSHTQPTPSGRESSVERVGGSSASTGNDITQQLPSATTGGGAPRKNTEGARLWVKFQDPDTEEITRHLYPDPKEVESRKYPNFYATRKAMHFIFRHQVWESFREEFPIIRWFLKPHELSKMPKSEIPSLENKAYKTEGNVKQNIEVLRQESGDPSEPQSKDEIRNLLKIVRVNPQRTCIARIFKRASEKKIKGRGMILVPAIGHPRTRGKYKREVFMYYFTDILFVLSIAAPYLITFALTGYQKGGSTTFQRVIVVLWLVMMQVACIPQRIVWNFVQTRLVPLGSKALDRGIYFIIVAGVLWSVPGIIGFINVLHMMVNDNKDTCDGACEKPPPDPLSLYVFANLNSCSACGHIRVRYRSNVKFGRNPRLALYQLYFCAAGGYQLLFRIFTLASISLLSSLIL